MERTQEFRPSAPQAEATPMSPPALLPGRVLGDFEVLRFVGEGGMGQVYRGQQISLKRPVALKVLRSELTAEAILVQRFHIEAEAVARLNHPHIVQIYSSTEV